MNMNMNSIEDIIKQWQILQVIMKEEITLSNIITEDQKEQLEQLKNCYCDYFSIKIQIDSSYKSNEFIFYKNADSILVEVYPVVYEILFRFRQNDQFIIHLIDIIERNNYMKDNSITNTTMINEFICFFCNQFYEDLFQSNNNEEQLFLIQKMIEREVDYLEELGDLKPNYFLSESTSFLGKYLKCYAANQDYISFIAMILNDAIDKIKTNDKAFELNLSRIYDHLKKKFSVIGEPSISPRNKVVGSCSGSNDIGDKPCNSSFEGVDLPSLTKCIPKSKFSTIIKRTNTIVKFKLNDNTYVNPSLSNVDYDYDNDNGNSKKDNGGELNQSNKDTSFNEKYMIELTIEKLKEIRDDVNSHIDLKEFCQRQLDYNQSYSNSKFLAIIKTYSSFAQQILCHYKLNFIFIKETIDIILKNLEENIDSIPYSLRCICKMISEAISKKKPNISIYERNSFIGEFFFRKCLTNFNIIKNFSPKAIDAFNTLSKILNKIARYQLFSEDIECQYSLFNQYIMEISIKLNEFYEKLIDVQLTEASPPEFTCIVFNLEMILHLYAIVKDKKESFDSLPNGKLFSKSIGKLVYHINKLESKVKKSKEKMYLALFKYDNEFSEHVIEEKVQLNQINNAISIEDKVKFCIKIILRRLNVINSKLYSLLNMADSNRNFLLALNEVIQLEEKKENSSDEDMNVIPLTWYSLFMATHLDNDNGNETDTGNETDVNNTISNTNDGYTKIYNDLLKEEQDNLIILKDKYTNNAIKIGLFLQCAQNKIEKTKMILRQKRKDCLNIIAQKIINEFEIPICITRTDDTPNRTDSSKKKRSFFSFSFRKKKNSDKEEIISNSTIDSSSSSQHYFTLTPLSQCIHQRQINSKSTAINTDVLSKLYHSKSIKQFAYQLSELDEVQIDIKIGEQVYKTIQIINEYLGLVHHKINEQFPLSPNDTGFILELVEENIIHNISKKLHSRIFLEIDDSLRNKLTSLSNRDPSTFNVNKEYINSSVLNLAVICLNAIELKTTPREKLKVIESSLNIIHNLIKFSSNDNGNGNGNSEDKEEDDRNIFEPILKYILIQAQPSRLFANLNFIKALSHPNQLTGKYNKMLDQLESAAMYFIDNNMNDNEQESLEDTTISINTNP